MDILERLQLDITARLQSHPLFATVPVFCRAKGDVSSDVETALGVANGNAFGQTGLVVTVMMPVVDSPTPDAPGPRLDAIATVTVLGSRLLNTIGIQPSECAINVLAAIHHLRVPPIGQIVTDKRAIEPLDIGDESIVGYTCYFSCKFGLDAPPKLPTPRLTGTASAVTISNLPGDNADAEIYFTTDDSFPWSGNAAATKYTAPFAVTSGSRVRAGAYKTNLTPSDIASLTIGD